MDTILVLDFGGQTAQLIGRRIRDAGVYADIVPANTSLTDEALSGVRGLILSGSPYSVNDGQAPEPDPKILSLGLPILGICYGIQWLVHQSGGKISASETREFGRARLKADSNSPLLKGVPESFVSWMSHGDSIEDPGDSFRIIGRSEHGAAAILTHDKDQVFGLQFHPEVSHCEYGTEILENFAFEVCGTKREWTVDRYLEQARDLVRSKAGDRPVLLLISGGVDSTVTGALLLRSLPAEQIHLMYIDTGLMRKNETEEVVRSLKKLGAKHLHSIDASELFLSRLEGVEDPEEKRRIIGDAFIDVQTREVDRLGVTGSFLAQGTLYTDLIESGKGVGSSAAVIKSHHNVRSPLVMKKREEGLLIEPLSMLYKDEVRKLGRKLGVNNAIVERHPFPGPGLAVRILGAVTREKCRILREADALFIDELRRRDLYAQIWQAFCVLLPTKSVGVAGDSRRYGYVLGLRAVSSFDGMTADAFPFPMEDLLEISAKLTNQIEELGRVVYDVSSKPPSTIEWE
jgi:GMP synthase (glutamine-hydrolysing)